MKLILLGHWLSNPCLRRAVNDRHKAFTAEYSVATVAARQTPFLTSSADANAVTVRL
jgi:hypothetical protein